MIDTRDKSTGCSVRDDCVSIITLLVRTPVKEWAERYVNYKMWFWRKYCMGLVFTTSHGCDFFQNVLDGLDGKPWRGEGEYEENFRKFIKHYRK